MTEQQKTCPICDQPLVVWYGGQGAHCIECQEGHYGIGGSYGYSTAVICGQHFHAGYTPLLTPEERQEEDRRKEIAIANARIEWQNGKPVV